MFLNFRIGRYFSSNLMLGPGNIIIIRKDSQPCSNSSSTASPQESKCCESMIEKLSLVNSPVSPADSSSATAFDNNLEESTASLSVLIKHYNTSKDQQQLTSSPASQNHVEESSSSTELHAQLDASGTNDIGSNSTIGASDMVNGHLIRDNIITVSKLDAFGALDLRKENNAVYCQ